MEHGTQRPSVGQQLIIGLLGLIALRLWLMPVNLLPTAYAQPDSGTQLIELIGVVRSNGKLLSEIKQIFQEGVVSVQIVEGGKKNGSIPPNETKSKKP